MAPFAGWRQAWRRAAIGAVAISALAACQSGRPSGDPRVPVQPQRHKVALLVPLTGSEGPVSTSIANAARLALKDSGAATVELAVYDTGQGGAAAAATQAINQGNQLILGPLLSAEARAVGPVARRARVPVITFSNDREAAGDGVFLMGTVPDLSIERIVPFGRSRGALRFAALLPENLYGERVGRAFRTAVQRGGGVVATIQSYGSTASSLRAAAGRIRSTAAIDAVLIADDSATAALAAPLVGRRRRILGTELWGNDREIAARAGLHGAWYAAVPNANFDALVARYRREYDRVPYRLGSLGYDSVLLTVRAARDWPAGRPFPQRRLFDPEGFAGVDGIFRFRPDGVAERALEVREVRAAGTAVVSPAATSFQR